MDFIDALTVRLRSASRFARIALVAECGDRLCPIYEEYWVGAYSACVCRSIEIAWSYACGGNINEGEVQSCLTEVQDIVAFYRDEGIDVLGDTVTVVLRVLQSLSADEQASSLAVARGLLSTLDAAQSAEAMANQETPKAARTKVAMAEEEAWQEVALRLIEGWNGFVTRNIFEPLNDKPPKWLLDWRARRVR